MKAKFGMWYMTAELVNDEAGLNMHKLPEMSEIGLEASISQPDNILIGTACNALFLNSDYEFRQE